jgi:Spy/CpxP family protein refolding chaperone
MKRIHLLHATVIALLTALTLSTAYADPGSGKGQYGMHQGEGMHHDGGGQYGGGYHGKSWKKDLTKEQKDKLRAIKLDYLKKKMPLKAKMKAIKTDLALLMIADAPDMKAIDKKIDEMLAVKKELKKLKVMHKINVRKELTPEQRVKFDMHVLKKAAKGKKKCRYHQ